MKPSKHQNNFSQVEAKLLNTFIVDKSNKNQPFSSRLYAGGPEELSGNMEEF